MNRYVIDGPMVQVPARIALLLERHLKLNDLRLAVRGRDRELDEVLVGWHAVALQYVDERTALPEPLGSDLGSDVGTSVGAGSEPAGHSAQRGFSPAEVAEMADCTPRAVVKAANDGRLTGSRVGDGPRAPWVFQPDDAAAWIATRDLRS